MHFPHNVSFVCMWYFPHNDQLGCTHFPHNALSPQCIICTYVCTFPTTPTRTHRFSPQCTFPTMYHLYVCVYFPHNDQLGCTDFPTMHFPHNVSFVRMCVFSPQQPTRMHTFSPQCTFPTMYHLYLSVYVPHNNQLGRTDFPDNALSPQCTFPTIHFPHNVSFVRMCVFSPQRPTRTHRFSSQCTFPTMYHLYVCVYFPHNDQPGCTHFPHNALSPQCIICTYVCTFPTTTN